jgi:hypothetical protein
MALASDIPKAYTPPGGYGESMPPPILADCTEAIGTGLPDFRGLWRVLDVVADGERLPPGHPVWSHTERIEQAANRVVITSQGIIHDMYADGTVEGGVNDVAALDYTTPIVVTATFEADVLVLRPAGMPGVEIRRWRDGDHLMWSYHTAFTARLARDSSTQG